MSNDTMVQIALPFEGFCGYHDEDIDYVEEGMIYNMIEDHPELDGQDFTDIISEASNYPEARMAVVNYWIEGYHAQMLECTGLKFSFNDLELVSPREYNFSNDTLFANVPFDELKALYNTLDRDYFAKVIKDKCTSRSGFISFYSNDIDDWLAKPLEDWDAQELGMMLTAAYEQFEIREALFYYVGEQEGSQCAISDTYDWGKIEAWIDTKTTIKSE